MITVLYIAAGVITAVGSIFFAWRNREFRKFLAGAFFVSSGVLFYLYLADVSVHRADCRTRKLQRSASQYDDLARLPPTQSRSGSRRRTIAVGDWRRASARCSRGVVPPVCDARFVGLILAVFIGATDRRQERVCRAQRLKAKIDAIATSAGGRDRMPRV